MTKNAPAPDAAALAVRDRILETAARLFHSQGYVQTGLNQILTESRAARASFYDHYPSKDDLGRAYLAHYSERQLEFLGSLMERNQDPHSFVEAWMRILKREVRRAAFFGCPIANLRAQAGGLPSGFDERIVEVTERTLALLAAFVRSCQEKRSVPKSVEPRRAARQVFVAYHGVLQLWRLGGRAESLDEMWPMCRGALEL